MGLLEFEIPASMRLEGRPAQSERFFTAAERRGQGWAFKQFAAERQA
jgi:hypothetical protein